ncbi:MAG: hypothetical protein Q9187_006265 [Circinaria calcarea]
MKIQISSLFGGSKGKKGKQDILSTSSTPFINTPSQPSHHLTSAKNTSASLSTPSMSTRRPKSPAASDPPPAYQPPTTTASTDSPFAFLANFDTVFLIDDSGSMVGKNWTETGHALAAIIPTCVKHGKNGVDIYFLNHPDNSEYKRLKRPEDVEAIFKTVQPRGGTPTGTRLNHLIRDFFAECKKNGCCVKDSANWEEQRARNIIVITDGEPSDDVESVIINAAKKLDEWGAPPWQLGIQFFQVGNSEEATKALIEMDDFLGGDDCKGKMRDIVDTVPWSGQNGTGLNSDGILKVVLGAVNKRLDRKKNSSEWRR